MKRILFSLFIIITISLLSLVAILTTIGFETSKFNKLISNKVAHTNDINLKLKNNKI